MKPDRLEREGEDWLVGWSGAGIGMAFSRLRESDSGRLSSELTVEGRSGLLWWGHVGLSTAADRDRLIKTLSEAAPDVADWAPTIHRTFQEVAVRHRAPAPLVRLADVPLDETDTYLWAPVCPAGQTSIVMADRGTGKSYQQLLLAVCVATGRPLPFCDGPLLHGPVLYLDYESSASAQRRRLERVCAGLGLSELPRELHYRGMNGKGRLLDHARYLRADVQKTGSVLTIVDSLAWACADDVTRPEVAIPTMDAIGSLGPCAKYVSAHFKKEDRNGRGGASVFGSVFFEASARSVWELRRESEGELAFNLGLFCRKANDAPTGDRLSYRMSFDNQRRTVTFGSVTFGQSAELSDYLPISERLRNMMASGSPQEIGHMAERLGEKADAVRKALARMPDAELAYGGKGQKSGWRIVPFRDRAGGGTGSPEKGNGTMGRPYIDGVSHSPADAGNGTYGTEETGRMGQSPLKEDAWDEQYPFEA